MGSKSQVVSFHCVLRNRLGKVLSFTYNNQVLMDPRSAPESGIDPLRELMEEMKDLKPGERREIHVSADRAFGFYRSDLVLRVPRSRLDKHGPIEVGMEVLASAGHIGDRAPRLFRVIDLTRTHAIVDGNHPFAGQDLIFEVVATEVRDATNEELRKTTPPPPTRPEGGLLH